MSIYGPGTYNPFGSLPYGYNPNSQSSVISTGTGLWCDDNTCFNLNDSMLVQNLPETRSYMNSMMQYNPSIYNPCGYQTNPMGQAGYYDNLLQSRSSLEMFRMMGSSSSSCMENMMPLLSLLMQMQGMEQAKAKQEKQKTEAESTTAKEYDKNHLADFVKNKHQESTLVYGDFEEFAQKNFDQIRGNSGLTGASSGKPVIRVNDALKSVGINPDTLPSSTKKELYGSTRPEVAVFTIDQYRDMLKGIGLNENSNTIDRQDLEDGKSAFIRGKSPEEVKANTKEAKQKIIDFNTLVADSSDENTQITEEQLTESLEGIANDPAAFKEFLKDEKGLSSVYVALHNINDDEAIAKFRNVIDSLKKAAATQNLGKEWNTATTTLAGADNTEHKRLKKQSLREDDNDKSFVKILSSRQIAT